MNYQTIGMTKIIQIRCVHFKEFNATDRLKVLQERLKENGLNWQMK
jgi:hypothetical protein